MADHQELVTEMGLLEKMSTQDRLKLAKKRRIQQLKKWSQREKEFTSKRKKNDSGAAGRNARSRKCDYKVHFVPSVMLLEAAARNDIDEGEWRANSAHLTASHASSRHPSPNVSFVAQCVAFSCWASVPTRRTRMVSQRFIR